MIGLTSGGVCLCLLSQINRIFVIVPSGRVVNKNCDEDLQTTLSADAVRPAVSTSSLRSGKIKVLENSGRCDLFNCREKA